MDADELELLLRQDSSASAAGPAATGITLRQRWQDAMHFRPVDRLPNFEFGYWAQTLQAWHAQGLPPEIDNEAKAYAWFGIENWATIPLDVMGLRPAFVHEVIDDDGVIRTYRDATGTVARINIQGDQSIPQYLSFPVSDRASWEAFRHRVQPTRDRLHPDWPQIAARLRAGDAPVAVPIGSMIGLPRNWIGFENIALMVYDDPVLLEEIVETCCQMVCTCLEWVLLDLPVDFGFGWEDICFNSGPIVGVEVMQHVVAPRYRRITDLLARHGCDISWVDCDGDVTSIVEAMRSGGLTCLFPVEVHGGSDPVALRRTHPDLRLQGGVCKMRLAHSCAAIDAEMQRLLPVVREGGFLPGVDHRVPADVPLVNYQHYLKVKRDLFGVGGEPQYDERAVP